ncbi:MAG: 1-deoxy-D-xylulose-5-phosphate reductoisomerase [Candidatus Caenarcaniphilales bacterium]|nr:1-deoxy-D-xylulose-5-phosphate reductoisomerase [Candidatus Caenarcaniphilales bacterium]
MKKIALLGATGSIGLQTVDLVRCAPDKYSLEALCASGNNLDQLIALALEFKPKLVTVQDESKAERLRKAIPLAIKVSCGLEALSEAVLLKEVDTVVVAVVGSIGMRPTLAALKAGKRVVVANKETLVSAGDLVKRYLRDYGGILIPADSEHVAIHQCLNNSKPKDVNKVYLTASGGPFFFSDFNPDKISVSEALNHPTWSMGPKITINSATLMNKGLEVIEAERLFNLNYDQIEVLVHPQSLIHSMVEFVDGNIMAQLGPNDMRIAIQYALDWPERSQNLSGKFLDFKQISKLEFYQPDFLRFPCLRLAYEAGKAGKTYPAVLVAADEVAVNEFLLGRIKFSEISKIVETTIENHNPNDVNSLQDIEAADSWARIYAQEASKKVTCSKH